MTSTDREEPTLLSADQVTYDEALATVTATGNVQISRGNRVLQASTVSYNQRTRVVVASGQVRLVEPTGEVIFADYSELTDDLKNGFIENIRLLLADNSRAAGSEAERADGRYLRMNRGVYSPCNLCADDPTKPPLWQVKAVRIVHDNEDKDVRYRDAVLELAGVPVAYTPYLSHPDPTVKRRSGFLAPTWGQKDGLGALVRNDYYFDIAPDMDATLETTLYSEQRPLVGGEWRQRLENGRIQLNGSVTQGDFTKRVRGRNVTRPDTWQGHLFGNGLFDLDDSWRWGFDVQRASNKTFLRRYYDFRENVLDSRLFSEGFMGRNYAVVNAYDFQDLRQNNREEDPLVLPLVRYTALGEPGETLGGRWSLDSGFLSLLRSGGNQVQRFSVSPGWSRDFVADAGFITTLSANLRSDLYFASDYRPQSRPRDPEIDATTARVMPVAQMTVRYPLVRQTGSVQQLFEPIAALTLAPNPTKDPDIPNEDSEDLEFDDTSLFLPNRFPGIDRQEGGQRLSYGVRTGVFGFDGGSATLFAGQSYRFNKDDIFPTHSGLEDNFSDYVGRLQVTPGEWVDASYAFRLDKDTFEPRKHEVAANIGAPALRMHGNYVYLNQNTNTDAATLNNLPIEREYAILGASSSVAQYWTVTAAHSQALAPEPGPRASALLLTYQDECFTFQAIGQRDYTKTPGVESGTTIYFRLVFKNLGEVTSPKVSGDLFGGRNENDATP
ncbi:MAG TPA: LPS assembly protein LptD [Azospirillaceae bacterium]|nr:LPS assembly protein LptD [Azospirillaceae bacterium]